MGNKVDAGVFGVVMIAGFIGILCFLTTSRNENILIISDCVDTQWEEYEGRTGEMPSQPLEQMWWRECTASLQEG